MLATLLDRDPFLGRILTGRIESGTLDVNMPIKAIDVDGNVVEEGRATKVFAFRGLERVPVESAQAGDIVAIAGLTKATVSNTIADPAVTAAAARAADRSADAGDELFGQRQPLCRAATATRSRAASSATGWSARPRAMSRSGSPRAPDKDAFEVAGRGELQLGVLIETMRREGFELSISRPRVLFRDGPSGREEPYETVVIDVDDEILGHGHREDGACARREMTDMRPSGGGKTRLTFSAPSRGLIGYHGEFLSDTRGTGIMNRLFEKYGPYKGPIQGRQNGVLISMEQGEAVAYALNTLEERGILFISPGDEALRRHGHRRERQDPGPRGQSAEVQAADQLPRLRPQGRRHPPDPAAADDAGAGDRLHPGRRAGRSDAQGRSGSASAILDPHERKRQSRKMEAA